MCRGWVGVGEPGVELGGLTGRASEKSLPAGPRGSPGEPETRPGWPPGPLPAHLRGGALGAEAQAENAPKPAATQGPRLKWEGGRRPGGGCLTPREEARRRPCSRAASRARTAAGAAGAQATLRGPAVPLRPSSRRTLSPPGLRVERGSAAARGCPREGDTGAAAAAAGWGGGTAGAPAVTGRGPCRPDHGASALRERVCV